MILLTKANERRRKSAHTNDYVGVFFGAFLGGEKKDYNNYFTLGEKIKSVTWVDNGESVNFTQDGDRVNVIPSPFRYGQDLVVRIAKIEI